MHGVVLLDAEMQSTVDRRLARIEVRVRSIAALTAGGVACPRLLNELAAAQEALSQVAHGVGRFHVSSCVQSAEPHAEISQMLELIDIFDRFLV